MVPEVVRDGRSMKTEIAAIALARCGSLATALTFSTLPFGAFVLFLTQARFHRLKCVTFVVN